MCICDFEITKSLGRSFSMDRQVLQHVTTIDIKSLMGPDNSLSRHFPRLARVSVGLDIEKIEINEGGGFRKVAWEDNFTDAELASNPSVSRIEWRNAQSV